MSVQGGPRKTSYKSGPITPLIGVIRRIYDSTFSHIILYDFCAIFGSQTVCVLDVFGMF